MKMRLGTGKLYFIGLRADINWDPYLIIKTSMNMFEWPV